MGVNQIVPVPLQGLDNMQGKGCGGWSRLHRQIPEIVTAQV